MIQTFGARSTNTGATSRGAGAAPDPQPVPAKSFWARLRAWFRLIWHLDDESQALKWRLDYIDSQIDILRSDLFRTISKNHEVVETRFGLVEAHVLEKIAHLKDTLPDCACLLDKNRAPLEFLPGLADQLQVEVVSNDGAFKFIRPLSHPDVAECLLRDDFICRRAR